MQQTMEQPQTVTPIEATIEKNVFERFGKPKNLHHVAIRIYKKWESPQRARVNLWCTSEIHIGGLASGRELINQTTIEKSYFLHVSDKGEIIKVCTDKLSL